MHISIRGEFRKDAFGQVGLILLIMITTIALLGPIVAPCEPNHQTRLAFTSPSWFHILGTNHVGQDNWSRLVYGARTSLLIGFLVACVATLISAVVGSSCALKGGLWERIVMRFVDGFLIIPAIVVLILVSAYTKPRLYLLILLISLFSWAGGARVIWAQALSLKDRAHIWAARSFGGSRWYVIRRHILPDLGPILVVEFIHSFRRAIFMEAGLAFLGICDPTRVSWGTMMRNAIDYSYMNVWMWWLVPAGLALSITILSLAFIGNTLEPFMEPRLREHVDA
jgi:peptide/nickel transport system permease protein